MSQWKVVIQRAEHEAARLWNSARHFGAFDATSHGDKPTSFETAGTAFVAKDTQKLEVASMHTLFPWPGASGMS